MERDANFFGYLTGVETIFAIFHTSVIFLFIKQRHCKTQAYCTAFYLYFIHMGIWFIVYYIINIIIFKFPKMSLYRYYQIDIFWATLFYAIQTFVAHFQTISYTIMAINTYSVLKRADKINPYWSKKWTYIGCCIMYIYPLLITLPRMPFGLSYSISDGGIPLSHENSGIDKIVTWINTITFAINFIIATIYEFLSYLKYSKICKTKNTCARNGLNENRLFFHTFYLIFCTIIRVIYQSLILATIYLQENDASKFIQDILPTVLILSSFIGTAVFLIINVKIRQNYFQTFGCRKATKIKHEISQPKIPSIFRIVYIQAFTKGNNNNNNVNVNVNQIDK